MDKMIIPLPSDWVVIQNGPALTGQTAARFYTAAVINLSIA